MKFIKYIVVLACFSVVSTSCEDYLTKTIEFEEIGFEPVMVINAKLIDSLDYLNVSVSKNVNYANRDSPTYEFIDGAVVNVKIDGQLFVATEMPDNVEDVDLFNHRLDFPDGFVLTGKKYEIEVSHPEYTTVTSSIQIATAPLVEDIEFEEEARTTIFFGYPVIEDEAKFTIVDQSPETNYYAIQIIILQDFGESQPGTSSENAGAINIPNRFVLISDENFTDGKIEMSVFSENFGFYEEGQYFLEVKNISRSEYLFQQSYDKYRQSQDFGFFAEPTTLFSNIENGLGLFSALEVQRYELN